MIRRLRELAYRRMKARAAESTPRSLDRRIILGGIAVVCISFAASVALRVWQFSETTEFMDIDASYHVLLTTFALHETPPSVHHGLPIVSLGRPEDKGIPWGAAVPDDLGNYYYTSFPPLGFLIPWGVFSTLGVEPSLRGLMYLNFCIHALATLGAFLLGARMSQISGAPRQLAFFAGCVSAVIYTWNTEALYSHGVIYWHHSVFQAFWIAQLLALTHILEPNSSQRSRQPLWTLFFVLSILCPATEWTGYVANVGIFLILLLFLFKAGRRDLWWPLILTAVASVLALALFVLPFITTITPAKLLAVLRERAAYRGTTVDSSRHFVGTFLRLCECYLESYGPYIPLMLVLSVVGTRIVWRGWRVKAQRPLAPLAILAVAGFALVENAVLTNHAIAYTFDRLKFSVVIVLTVSFLLALLKRRGQAWLVGGVACCVALTLAQFLIVATLLSHLPRETQRFDKLLAIVRRARVASELETNQEFVSRLAGYEDATYASFLTVRGYAEVLFQRGIFEEIRSLERLDGLIASRESRLGVWLFGDELHCNLCVLKQAIVRNREGGTVAVLGVMTAEEAEDGVFTVDEQAFPLFVEGGQILVGTRQITIDHSDPTSRQVFLKSPPNAGAGPVFYSLGEPPQR